MRKTALVLIATIITVTQAHATRWYSANTGRWFSRDPMNAMTGSEDRYKALIGYGVETRIAWAIAGSREDADDYVFVQNSPSVLYDFLGLCIPLPDSGQGTYHGNAVKHRLFGGDPSSLTFRVCCPRPTQFLVNWGLSSTNNPPPKTPDNNVFPGSYTLVTLTGGDAGDKRCYTIVVNVPTTHGLFEQNFIKSIRVTGSCCCDRTGLPIQINPTPLPIRQPPLPRETPME